MAIITASQRRNWRRLELPQMVCNKALVFSVNNERKGNGRAHGHGVTKLV